MATAAQAPQVRGERLVAKVLEATLTELSDVGYRALSIETVAERADVNKTTIYRRWPTKAELVRDAFKSMIGDVFTMPDEGSLRADLFVFTKRIRDIVASPQGRGLFRVMAAEGQTTELASVLEQIHEMSMCIPVDISARAVKRGEIPKGADPELLVSCVVAPVLNWVQMDGMTVSDRRIEEVIDLVLLGATNGGATVKVKTVQTQKRVKSAKKR